MVLKPYSYEDARLSIRELFFLFVYLWLFYWHTKKDDKHYD